MADDVILARFRADVTDLKKELDDYINTLEKAEKQEQKTGNESKKAGDKELTAAQKRNQALKSEEAELKRLQQARNKAFDPKVIDSYNKKIAESQRNISLLKGETENLGSSTKAILGGIAEGIAAAFTIGKVIEFGKASIDAFLEAEKSLERLRFAVVTLGGESNAVFERLVKQSEEVQKVSIFGDDAIQRAQAALASFGLTGRQIEELIPSLADFATITGTDITEAAQKVGAGLQGAGREFKKFGIEVSATNTPLENLVNITEGLTKQQGAAADATKTLTGQLEQAKNRAGDLQEEIGKRLADSFVNLRLKALEAFETILNGIFGIENLRKKNLQKFEQNTEERVRADLQTRAELLNTTLLDQANKELLKTKDKLLLATKEVIAAEVRGIPQGITLANKRVSIIKEEQKALETIISIEEIQKKQNDRVLTQVQIKNKTTERLLELKKEEGGINDIIAQSNIQLIEEELKARIKAADEAKKLSDKLLQEYLANLAKIRASDATATQDELAQIAKRDKAFLDSLEKKRKELEAFQAEAKQLSDDAQRALTDEFLKSASIEDLKTRLNIAKTFQVELERDLAAQIQKLNTDSIDKSFEERKKLADKIILLEKATADRIKEIYAELNLDINQTRLQEWVSATKEQVDISLQIINNLSQLYSTFTDKQIAEVDREKNAKLKALDEIQQQNEFNLKQRRVSEVGAAAIEKQLRDQKVKEEEAAAKKIRDINRKQAIIDKAAALFEIAIRTAVNVVEKPALSAFYIALGASQAALVAARPIPYKKGTKSAKGGLSLVGEEGPEQMMVPKDAKIAPAKQTKKYEKVFDSIVDNRFEDLILKDYITPALKKQKQQFEAEKERSFAENITKSIYYNSGLDESVLDNQRRKGQILTDETISKLGKAVASNLKNDPYRR